MKRSETWLVLPTPPSVNHKYVSRTFVLTKQYREYKDLVAKICLLESVPKYIGDVEVALNWYRPSKRGDIDGVIKPVLDGLTMGGAWEDDKQVSDLKITRSDFDPKDAKMVVRIEGFIKE